MNVNDLLLDAFDRLRGSVHSSVAGLGPQQLLWVPTDGANPVGWLIWHLTRIQDSHIAELLETDQLWQADGWAQRFGLDPDPSNTGYGHTAEDVATVRPHNARTLTDYYDAVADRTTDLLRTLTPPDLDRVVDLAWDPPVTLGVRLISVLNDDSQHAGQAAYVRGLLKVPSQILDS